MLVSSDIHLEILGLCSNSKVFTPQGVHEGLKGRISLREKSTDNHIGKENYDGYVMLHEDELNALLVEEPIANPIPKKESNEKDTMSHINNHERS